MATFKYVATRTKPNGKVDIKIGPQGASWRLVLIDHDPDDNFNTTDDRQIQHLQLFRIMPEGTLAFEQIS